MFILLLFFITLRPFICSFAFLEPEIIYATLLSLFLLSWIFIKKIELATSPRMTIALSLFLLALAVSLIFPKNQMFAAIHTCQFINGLLLFLVCRSLPREKIPAVLLSMLITALFICALALYQSFGKAPEALTSKNIIDQIGITYIEQHRAYAPFITPNALGGYLILIIPLAFTLKNRAWLAAPLILTLLLTKSLGAIISFTAATTLYFYFQGNLKKKRMRTILLGLIAGALIIFLIRAQANQHIFQPSFSVQMRLEYWRLTWKLISAYPLTGTGPGCFDLPDARYTHNSYLQLWAETGIIGITSFLYLLFTLFKSGRGILKEGLDKNLAAGLIWASVGFFIHNFFDFTFFLPEVSFMCCVVLGLLLNRSPLSGAALIKDNGTGQERSR